MTWLRWIFILAISVVAVTASAQAPQKRVALIIANSAYQGERVLENPARDAALVQQALQRAGFTVRVAANLTQQQMTAELQRFRRDVEGAQVALIYFAGHGVRVGQTNWMLPVDFRADEVKQDEDFELFAIAHRSMTQALAGARVKVAVFDACRNNPYEARLQLAARSAGRSSTASSGLAGVEIGDVLVLFSAAPGQIATDGAAGQGTPFAQAFARRLVEPGAEIGLIARRVRADVITATGGERSREAQRPFVGGSPGPEEVVLISAAPTPVVAAVRRSGFIDVPEPLALIGNIKTEQARGGMKSVPFARGVTGINLYGNVDTWPAQAAARYARVSNPVEGGVVIVEKERNSAHMAVVRRVVSERLILVDHADWENEGEITTGLPVADVSPMNDWSFVRFWRRGGGGWQQKAFAVTLFISAKAPPSPALGVNPLGLTKSPQPKQ